MLLCVVFDHDRVWRRIGIVRSGVLRQAFSRAQCIVARNDLNRALIWEVDGLNYYRSSAMELDGAASPRSYFFTVRELPAGSFEIRVTVRRNDNSEAVDRSRIRVVGGSE